VLGRAPTYVDSEDMCREDADTVAMMNRFQPDDVPVSGQIAVACLAVALEQILFLFLV